MINVEKVTASETLAMVICTIPNYKYLIKHVQVGESIATNEPFEMNYPGFSSKWKIIFFPRGQFDFGLPSDDCRAYVKLISCDRMDLKVKVKIFLLSSSVVASVSNNQDVSMFAVNDNKRNWAGPFHLQSITGDKLTDDTLTLKCSFKLILSEKEKDTLNCKRSLCEVDSSAPAVCGPLLNSSKKTRSSLPPVDDTDNSKVNVEMVSPKDPPNPFNTKSPLSYAKISKESPRKKFVYRQPSRAITSADRSGVKNLPWSCSKLSLNRSEVMSEPNSQPQKWISSQCLKVSDIFGNKEADKNEAEAGPKDESDSDAVRTLS